MCGFTVIFRCQKLFEFNFVVVVLNTFFLFLSLILENHLMTLLFIQISLSTFLFTEFFVKLKRNHMSLTQFQNYLCIQKCNSQWIRNFKKAKEVKIALEFHEKNYLVQFFQKENIPLKLKKIREIDFISRVFVPGLF